MHLVDRAPSGSSHHPGAPPPEVPVEEQEERPLHEHAQPEATQGGLLASEQQPGGHEVEHVEPGVESEDGQQLRRALPPAQQGEPGDQFVDEAPESAHERLADNGAISEL